MKLKAMGNFLLVRAKRDFMKDRTCGGIILPDEYVRRTKGGCQIYEVLSIGSCAFDDQPPETREEIVVGSEVLTGRYPGHAVDLDVNAGDEEVNALRIIADTEVHALVSEDGADV